MSPCLTAMWKAIPNFHRSQWALLNSTLVLIELYVKLLKTSYFFPQRLPILVNTFIFNSLEYTLYRKKTLIALWNAIIWEHYPFIQIKFLSKSYRMFLLLFCLPNCPRFEACVAPSSLLNWRSNNYLAANTILRSLG